MSQNDNSYDIHPHIAEAYDRHETQTDDVELIRKLISGRGPVRILEPFCGTGRILIPLAEDGHEMVGLDQAGAMLDRARAKIALMPPQVQSRITLIHADATAGDWPGVFELVLLGGNCFYELASPEEQEGCVASAAAALTPGGHVYVDNDHMETALPEAWTRPGVAKTKWPSARLADGTIFEGYTENLDCDAEGRIWRARRSVLLRRSDGRTQSYSFLQQKHPVSYGEVKGWLERHGFVIERTFGDRAGNPYAPDSPRAIFWARKDKG